MSFLKKYYRLFLLFLSAILFAVSIFVFDEKTEASKIFSYLSIAVLVFPLLFNFFLEIKDGDFSYECLFLLMATIACVVMQELEEAESLVFFYNMGEFIEELIESKFEDNSDILPLNITKSSLEKFSKYYTGVVAILSLLAFLFFLYYKNFDL